MSSTSSGSSVAPRAPRTSAIRWRQRSTVAMRASSRSRSTTEDPLPKTLLCLAPDDFQVLVTTRERGHDALVAERVSVQQEPAVAQDLHDQNRRGLVQVDQVHLVSNQAF